MPPWAQEFVRTSTAVFFDKVAKDYPEKGFFSQDWLKTVMPDEGRDMQEWRDPVEKGLIFRVTRNGVRRFSARYRDSNGEHRRTTIGPFPAVSLMNARRSMRDLKSNVPNGEERA